MLNKLAAKISSKMLQRGIISDEMFDIYVYGFELVLSFLFGVAVMLFIGIVSDRIFHTLIFLLVFVTLRSFTGGYHANTYGVCFMVTISIFVVTLLLSEYINISWWYYCFLLLIGVPIIYVVAPIEHPNKPLDMDDKARCKMISIILFLSFNTVGMVFTKVNVTLSAVIFFTLVFDLILLFYKSKEGGRKT
jgi:accessory gene regulator B